MVIDHRVAKHAVEPRDGRLAVAHRVGALDAFDERLLQDVLRLGTAAETTFEKAQNSLVVAHQTVENGGCQGGLHRVGVVHVGFEV